MVGGWVEDGWMDGKTQIKISLFPASGYTKSQATSFAAYDWTSLGLVKCSKISPVQRIEPRISP